MPYNTPTPNDNIVGNNYVADSSAGFKADVAQVFESYSTEGVNLFSNDLYNIVSSPKTRSEFVDAVLESFSDPTSPIQSKEALASPFYNDYTERVHQLTENSLLTIAREAVTDGYRPIVAYVPFFIRKQWADCVMKDALMTEIPKTPVVNLAFERDYIKTMDGRRYALPDALYNEEMLAELYAEATGLSFLEDPIPLPMNKVYLIDPTYVPGVIYGDQQVELTVSLHVFQVTLQGTVANPSNPTMEYTVPVNAIVDVTTHNFIHGDVRYDVYDTSTTPPTYLETLEDTLIGRLDTIANTISLMSESNVISEVFLRGKLANRWNERGLETVREVENIQKVMPESGPRINVPVTVEDAQDAIALQNIDIVAYNVDRMGNTFAAFEDGEILAFLRDSFIRTEALQEMPFGYQERFTRSGEFDAMPPKQYAQNISSWMQDSREYFDRLITELKPVLKSSDMIAVAIGHPSVVRYIFKDQINWVFSNDTQISGMKINYNFGVYTVGQDRVHVLTSLRMNPDEGIRIILLPITSELVTFKHYKYNVIIDRNYRSPTHSNTPNIMGTYRSLTFSVLPVQGVMKINSRNLISPTTYER